MSYDIYIGNFEGNYTYNLCSFFRDFLKSDDKTGFDAIYGKTGYEAAPILSAGLTALAAETQRIGSNALNKKYNPENKWGSVSGATQFLARLLAACIENINEVIDVR